METYEVNAIIETEDFYPFMKEILEDFIAKRGWKLLKLEVI